MRRILPSDRKPSISQRAGRPRPSGTPPFAGLCPSGPPPLHAMVATPSWTRSGAAAAIVFVQPDSPGRDGARHSILSISALVQRTWCQARTGRVCTGCRRAVGPCWCRCVHAHGASLLQRDRQASVWRHPTFTVRCTRSYSGCHVSLDIRFFCAPHISPGGSPHSLSQFPSPSLLEQCRSTCWHLGARCTCKRKQPLCVSSARGRVHC